MLKEMLSKSKGDWTKDAAAFAKFKAYCEENEEKKTKAVQDATTRIGLLSNKIEEIQGSSGDLSTSTADLKADMAENVKARDDAKALRGKENKAFEAEKKDLTAASAQMGEAIKMLADIGADQTASSGADNAKFMGKFKEKNLLSIRTSVRQAQMAASSFLEPAQQMKLAAFVQAPFTGTYTSQSGQIVGILKDMKDTFKSNLEEGAAAEKKSQKSYDEFKKNKEDEHASMKKSYDEKQATLGTNDGDLSTKKKQLQQSSKQKDEDEDFLDKLSVQCKDKTDDYEKRKVFAANEEVALSKAVSILDNDVASEKFGDVKAASKFLQVSSRHYSTSPRAAAVQLLQQAGKTQNSRRMKQVLLLLQAGNPFTVVLKQIDNMIQMADDEQKVDNEEKAWCTKTNKKNADNLEDKSDELQTIKKDITKLKNDINDPSSGLKNQIKTAEDSLKTNLENQGKETKTRREENLEYQQDVHTQEQVIETLDKASLVLKDYYDGLDNEQLGFLQIGVAPKTFGEKYNGQNEQAKKVLGLLADIRKGTWDEEKVTHDSELKSQHDYEDSMEALTKSEAGLQETIVKLNKDLASKEKALVAAFEDETNTEKEKIAVERYIEKLKPGCDFILGKFDARKKARAAEKKALNNAISKLKGSPSYKSATSQAKLDALGKCKDTCTKDAAHANCKACLGGISVPGYCAGHKGAKGC